MPYELTIPSTATSASPKPFTLYNVVLSTPLRTQTLQKRYSDFVDLNAALTSSAGTPPASLPAKSWFSRTVNNPQLTEDRRKGLVAYVKAIEEAPDPKWRSSAPYRSFLGFSLPTPTEGKRKTSELEDEAIGQAKPVMTSQQWLDLHAQLKQHIQESRMCLTRRDQASTVTQQHDASAQAKKWLVKAHTLILRLEEGLRGLQSGGERLGEGEIRRRRDLLTRARKEREALEGVCAAPWSISGTRDAANGYGARSSNNSDAASINSNGSMPGAFPSGPTKQTGRRVLGGPPAKETERTRELNNQGVLQLQQKVMQEQDMDVDELAKVVRRMREMGVAINEELVEQGQLMDVLDEDVDRVGGKIGVAKKRIKKIN
jgi:regulator of vacuolar morphogenesis